MKLLRLLFPFLFEPIETTCDCGHPMRLHRRTNLGVLCPALGCLCLAWVPCVSRAERRRHLMVVRKEAKHHG